jgi:ribonuclease HI
MSVIIGLQAALAKGIQDIDVYMDSQLVIKQCNKEWKINVPLLQQLNNQVDSLKQQFKNISFYWIPRAKNAIADRLSKEALIGY